MCEQTCVPGLRDAVRQWKARADALEAVLSETTQIPLSEGGCWCKWNHLPGARHDDTCEMMRLTFVEVPDAPGSEEVRR